MYGRLGMANEAEAVYGAVPPGDVVALSAMIGAYSQSGTVNRAKEMFATRDVVVWTTMLTAFAQNGDIDQVRQVFAEMPERNAVSWSAMIAANAQHGHGKEAVRLFKLMDLEGEFPQQQTIGSLIDACSAEPSMVEARIIQSLIRDNGFKLGVVLSSALINMYGKCGRLDLSRDVFESMGQRNIISWNIVIAIYAESGNGDEALYMFARMHLDGLEPDEMTLSSALGACCHSGLVEDAQYYFHLSHEYRLKVTLENYSCVIFLGRLADAEELIRTMPFEPREATWMILLGAYRDMDLGTRAGQAILDRDPARAEPYVLLSNVYT